MSELTCLELSVLLWVAHMLCQVLTNRGEFGDPYLFSSRDEQPTPKGLACGRAARAFRNYVENLVPFVAVDLALIATQLPAASARSAQRSGSSAASFICRSTSSASIMCGLRRGSSRSSVC